MSDSYLSFGPKVFWIQSRALTEANLKSRYRNTVAGFLWVVLNPLILYVAQSYVFHAILKIQVNQYNLFLLSGLLPWLFITQSLDMCTSLYTSAGRLLKSFPVHPLVYLVSQLLDNLVNFIAAFLLILIPTIYWVRSAAMGFFLLPVSIVFLLVAVFGMSLILAITQVFFRDTRFLVSFGLNICFYLTPIFYPIELVPPQYRWVVAINPFNYLIEPFRVSIYHLDMHQFILASVKAAVVSVGFAGIALVYWVRKRNDVFQFL